MKKAQHNSWNHWIAAMRPRTLPLAVASIGMGSFLAAKDELFDPIVFWLAALTAICLQILSNLANDYGDSVHGADSMERTGPKRAVQTGAITKKAMKNGMILLSILSFVSGIILLTYAIQTKQDFLIFFSIGIAAIVAAITYTSGAFPYGYRGLGDVFVLIFFGWVATLATYYLHGHTFEKLYFLPATALGLLTMAVINVNNVRDIESDRLAGKYSIPVRLGRDKAVVYHWLLLVGALILTVIYVLMDFRGWWQFLFLLSLPFLWVNGRAVQTKTVAMELDPYLKQMAIATVIFVITFGVGQLIA
ncbi:MAG: 1,4-dihydroxy-2-naphthoate polyprenyltransferase [Bacteroidota bacterium]